MADWQNRLLEGWKLMIDGCPTLHYPTLPLISAYHASPYLAYPALLCAALPGIATPHLPLPCPLLALPCCELPSIAPLRSTQALPLFDIPRLCPTSVNPGLESLRSTQAFLHIAPSSAALCFPIRPCLALSCLALRCPALPLLILPCLALPTLHCHFSPGSALLCV